MDSDTVVSDQMTVVEASAAQDHPSPTSNYSVEAEGGLKHGDPSAFLSPVSVSSFTAVSNDDSSVVALPTTHDIQPSQMPNSAKESNQVEIDESFWDEINENLQIHGLQRLHARDFSSVPTRSAFSVKIIITQLIKDNDRRQAIIQDLLATNSAIKDELVLQKETNARNQKTIREMEKTITRQKDKIKDVDEKRVGDLQSLSDKLYSLREEHHELRSRSQKLEQMNKHLRLEVDRAHRQINQQADREQKKKSDNQQVFHQIKAQCATGERVSDKKILLMIDHYENEIEKLRSKVSSLVTASQQQNQSMQSLNNTTVVTDAGSEDELSSGTQPYKQNPSLANKIEQSGDVREVAAYYKHINQTLEKDLAHLKRKLRESENEKALMKIEMDTRYTTNELIYSEKRIKILEAVLRNNNIKVPSTVDMNKSGGSSWMDKTVESTTVGDIRYLNIETTRKYLKMFCAHLKVDDLNEVVPALRQIGEKTSNHQKMKKFIQEVTEITSNSSLPCSLTPGNKREGSSRRTYGSCIQTLRLWADELKNLQSLYQAINTLVSTVLPSHKILPLSEDLTVCDLRNFVESISQDNHRQMSDEITGVDVKSLRDMVKHFQQLFDCPHLQGVYPRMNEVFSRLEESRNTINTFKDLLGLDVTTTSTRTLIGAFEAVCREFNNRTYDQLKSLVSSDDLETITEKVRVHDEFFPEFESMAEQVMQLLGVETLDRVVPAVRTLKLISSRSN